jgi:polar amino acid transport system ATP-binding protein/sulfate transport system ATP-binding protein
MVDTRLIKRLLNFGKAQWQWYSLRKQFHDRVMEYTDLFKLSEHLNKYPCELSGGQHQRLAILSQVLCSSHIIIMDEPLSGLDPGMKLKVCKIIEKVANLGDFNTIYIISHDIEYAGLVADYIRIIGHEKDSAGNVIPGSTILPGPDGKPGIDLAEMGLTWHGEDILREPEYISLVQHIKYDILPNV